MKKSKALEKRQLLTFYIRKEYIPLFYRFKEIIKKDPVIIKRRSKHSRNLTSIAITLLISSYVSKNNERFGFGPVEVDTEEEEEESDNEDYEEVEEGSESF